METVYCSETTAFTVEFYDLDPMDIVWHGNYVKYLELGRNALLNKIGFNYQEMKRTGYAFPVAEMKIKYVKPLRLGEKCTICAKLLEYENMIKIRYEIFGESGTLATKAETTQMAFNIRTNESEFASPAELIEKVEKLLKN